MQLLNPLLKVGVGNYVSQGQVKLVNLFRRESHDIVKEQEQYHRNRMHSQKHTMKTLKVSYQNFEHVHISTLSFYKLNNRCFVVWAARVPPFGLEINHVRHKSFANQQAQ